MGEGRLEMEGPPDESMNVPLKIAVETTVDSNGEGLSQDEPQLDGLRVLFAVDCEFPGLGGAEAQALKLAISLRNRGAFVEFVTPRILSTQSMEETFHGFTIRRIDYPHVRFVGSLVLMAYFSRYLRKNAHRFDAVHVHITHLMAATAGYVRKGTGLTVITKISGFYEFEGGVLDQRMRFKPLNMLLRKGLQKVDFVQTISEETRRKLLEADFRSDQIKFVPNGIDTGETPVVIADSAVTTLGYCGRLREVKGVHILLDAFAKVLQKRPNANIRLSIAGSGSSSEELLDQAKALGITNEIEWLGLIEDTQSYFRSIDIYVQPSFAEGLPNSVMEAMVEQQPVIASDIGGNNDLVEHEISGLRFPAGDAESLSIQIIRLLDDEQLKNSIAVGGRQVMEQRYDIERVVTKLADLYRV
ncbi:glycosyltransferase family 4 protein [Granulosicoccus sp.]|nr:glycosyltransferase family 4 protein [Granulosicoccus sp.]MDB4224092.1 glycosyltransferase family 4 protein [Granulosicoccus sp.]